LFAEILPKVWATHHNIWFALTASLLVEVVNSLLYRISKRIVQLTEKLENQTSPLKTTADDASQLDDVIDLLPEHEASLAEKQLLKGIRKFAKTEVKQVMRTRMDVSGMDISLPFNEIL
jgi:CBS domain containing-hemolysin-like protein